MNKSLRKRIAIGSILVILGGVIQVIMAILEDSTFAILWGSLISFIAGISTGSGLALVLANFVVFKQAKAL
jgi:hypothetical protein